VNNALLFFYQEVPMSYGEFVIKTQIIDFVSGQEFVTSVWKRTEPGMNLRGNNAWRTIPAVLRGDRLDVFY
jgi:hypothetical protein